MTVPSGATVQVTNVETGIKRDAKTSSDGVYCVISLGPGTYRAEVAAKGFRPLARTGIAVGITETARVDFALQFGATNDAVTVVAPASEVETEKAVISKREPNMLEPAAPRFD